MYQLPLFPTKQCSKCGNDFPATTEYFYTHKEGLFGLRSRCISCFNTQVRTWQGDNRKKVNAAIERYHKTHAEQTRYWQQKSYRKYYKTDKGKDVWRRLNDKRRAFNNGAEGHYSPQDIRDQHAKQSGKCFWCSEAVGNTFHVDHIIPLSRWGTNWPANIVISCPFCNDSKGNKIPFNEWFPKKCLGR